MCMDPYTLGLLFYSYLLSFIGSIIRLFYILLQIKANLSWASLLSPVEFLRLASEFGADVSHALPNP